MNTVGSSAFVLSGAVSSVTGWNVTYHDHCKDGFINIIESSAF